MSQALAEREAILSQRLQHTLLALGGYRTLCLVSYEAGTAVSQIGKIMLGEAAQAAFVPRRMRLEVRCLGTFEVRSSGKQVKRWQSVKAKSLFQYLMTRPRELVVRDVLMEALWPDCTPHAEG